VDLRYLIVVFMATTLSLECVYTEKYNLSVKTQVVIVITLIQISLYVRVDKKNSLESSLVCCTLLIYI